jgi:hypothetical protein
MFFLPSPPPTHALEIQVQPGEAQDPTRQSLCRQDTFQTFSRQSATRSPEASIEIEASRRGKIQVSFFQQKHAGSPTCAGDTCSSDISQAHVKIFR